MANPANQEKILIVESDSTFGDQIGSVLNKNGYSTVVVHSGVEGMKALNDIVPQLLILGVTLSDMDSYEFLAKKQEAPLLTKIPVFFVSAQGVPINMRRVPAGSVQEFIMALHSNGEDIVDKANRYFGHEAVASLTVGAGTGPGGKKIKIMWVEDDKLIGTILAKKLISSGFDLFHAKSGEEGLEALKQAIPDVIVLDLLLPGMGGFDVLQEINKDPGLRKVPVMILSNLSKPTDMERAKALGAKRFLIKAATSLEQIVKEIKVLCE